MTNTHKTKAEILQELESIKGLLLEEDDIPILQELEADEWPVEAQPQENPFAPSSLSFTQHESVLPGQGSLFDNTDAAIKTTASTAAQSHHSHQEQSNHPEQKRHGFASHLHPQHHHTKPAQNTTTKPLAKASGENPFLPQHIRERLHGNNPPPLFEYETAKKIISATKNIAHKTNKPRQHLIDEVITAMMPQIESELRHRLFAMSVEDLEKLLNEDEDL
ncbi:hypothetical protein [Cellvibrio sp. UBA7661]|uniref:hypothetical protein n=1 Tax=Cellvibrio sp. UBA7661 TaxID=1946311 RepID=UPI002F3566AF